MTVVVRVGLLAALIGAAAAGYFWWYGAERQIRRVLDSVAQGFSHDSPATGLAAVSRASALQPYFSADITIEPGRPFGVIRGRDSPIGSSPATGGRG